MSEVEHISDILEGYFAIIDERINRNESSHMLEFTVKVKDLRQNIVHKNKIHARSQRSANAKFIRFLRESMGHREFEIV